MTSSVENIVSPVHLLFSLSTRTVQHNMSKLIISPKIALMSWRGAAFVQKGAKIRHCSVFTVAHNFFKIAAQAIYPHLLSPGLDPSLLSQGKQHENHQNTSRTLTPHTISSQVLYNGEEAFLDSGDYKPSFSILAHQAAV